MCRYVTSLQWCYLVAVPPSVGAESSVFNRNAHTCRARLIAERTLSPAFTQREKKFCDRSIYVQWTRRCCTSQPHKDGNMNEKSRYRAFKLCLNSYWTEPLVAAAHASTDQHKYVNANEYRANSCTSEMVSWISFRFPCRMSGEWKPQTHYLTYSDNVSWMEIRPLRLGRLVRYEWTQNSDRLQYYGFRLKLMQLAGAATASTTHEFNMKHNKCHSHPHNNSRHLLDIYISLGAICDNCRLRHMHSIVESMAKSIFVSERFSGDISFLVLFHFALWHSYWCRN